MLLCPYLTLQTSLDISLDLKMYCNFCVPALSNRPEICRLLTSGQLPKAKPTAQHNQAPAAIFHIHTMEHVKSVLQRLLILTYDYALHSFS